MNSIFKNIDQLNILLVILSGVLAYLFPLELFLFSFAILGPLHYLTEINWLNTKNYFTTSNKYLWPFVGITASLILVIPRLYLLFWGDKATLSTIFLFFNQWSNAAIFISLMLAVALISFSKKQHIYVLTAIAIVVAILLNHVESYSLFIGILIPTVIHVYLFTLIFMLYGAKKSNSKLGVLTVILAIIIPIFYTFINLDFVNYSFSDYLKSIYIENNLHVTPVFFAKFFGLSDGKTFFFYENLELRLMMFMSFIYLYHYLNWFSKTTAILWHKTLTLKKSIAIFSAWFIMLVLFYIDFQLGFLTALFFSFLHVILEFPLNIVSIKSLLTNSKK